MLLLVILLKSNTFHGCFSRFLNRTNSTNSRKVSQMHRMSISSKIYSFLIESDPDSDSSSTPDGNYILKGDILFSCWALKWSNSVFSKLDMPLATVNNDGELCNLPYQKRKSNQIGISAWCLAKYQIDIRRTLLKKKTLNNWLILI